MYIIDNIFVNTQSNLRIQSPKRNEGVYIDTEGQYNNANVIKLNKGHT